MILTRTTGNLSEILCGFVEKFKRFEKIRYKSEQRFIKEYTNWPKTLSQLDLIIVQHRLSLIIILKY